MFFSSNADRHTTIKKVTPNLEVLPERSFRLPTPNISRLGGVALNPAQLAGSVRLFLTAVIFLLSSSLILTGLGNPRFHAGEKVVCVVGANVVKLRSGPTISPGTVLARVPGGTQLKYLDSTAGWYKVELADGRIGWLTARYGRLDSARELLEVSTAVARIRESNDMDSPVIARVTRGLMLEILGAEKGWHKVRLPLGKMGWIREDLVTFRPVLPAPGGTGNFPQSEATGTPQETASRLRDDKTAAGDPGDFQDATSPTDHKTESPDLAPFVLSASADAERVPGENRAGGSPPALTSRIPAEPDGTVFLVSIVAGLSVFLVLLGLGTIVLRRKLENRSPLHAPSADTEEERATPEDELPALTSSYSDPLLTWMGRKPEARDKNGRFLNPAYRGDIRGPSAPEGTGPGTIQTTFEEEPDLTEKARETAVELSLESPAAAEELPRVEQTESSFNSTSPPEATPQPQAVDPEKSSPEMAQSSSPVEPESVGPDRTSADTTAQPSAQSSEVAEIPLAGSSKAKAKAKPKAKPKARPKRTAKSTTTRRKRKRRKRKASKTGTTRTR